MQNLSFKSLLVKSLHGLCSVAVFSLVGLKVYRQQAKVTLITKSDFVHSSNTSLTNSVHNPSQLNTSSTVVVAPDIPATPVKERKSTVHLMKAGETINKVFEGQGVAEETVGRVLQSLKKVYNPKAFREGQKIEFVTERTSTEPHSTLLSLQFRTTGGHRIKVDQQGEGKYKVTKEALKLIRVVKRVEGTIKSSFYSSALKNGVPAPVVKEAISALSYDINWQHDPKQHDPYCLVFEALVDEEGQVVSAGSLKFAAFSPAGSAWRKIYAFKSGGTTNYFNEKGESVVRSLLRTPVNPAKMRITSKFGNRTHPIYGFTKHHKGIDFGAPIGTPVSAAGDGVVVKACWYGGYGNYVLIRHNKDYSTAYAHLSKIRVKPGQVVKQKQIIGSVGNTGNSTGPHLHHEVIFKGKQINPLSVKMLPETRLSGKELKMFHQVKGELEKGFEILQRKNLRYVAGKSFSRKTSKFPLQLVALPTEKHVG